jgi:hypothetical protein
VNELATDYDTLKRIRNIQWLKKHQGKDTETRKRTVHRCGGELYQGTLTEEEGSVQFTSALIWFVSGSAFVHGCFVKMKHIASV